MNKPAVITCFFFYSLFNPILHTALCETSSGSDSGPGIRVELTTARQLEIEPGKIVTASFQVANITDRAENLTENIVLPEDWRLVIPARHEQFTIESSGRLTRLITIFVPGKALAGNYKIKYSVQEITSGKLPVSDTFTVIVKPLIKIEALPVSAPEAVIAGEEYTVQFRVSNRGNATSTAEISLHSTPRYRVKLVPSVLELKPAESEIVEISIKTDDRINRQINNVLDIEIDVNGADNHDAMVKTSIHVKIIPKITTQFDPYLRIPTTMNITYASEEEGSGYQIDYSGKGSLDEEEKQKVYFQFRGPDIQDINPYGRRDQFQLGYSYGSMFSLDIGDRGYALSPLTKMYVYGRGAELRLQPGNIDFRTHYVENRWNRDDRQISSSLEYAVSQSIQVKGNFYTQQLEATRFNNRIASIQTDIKRLRAANIELEFAVNDHDATKKANTAYQAVMTGQLRNRITYDIRKTHADPGYHGYYQDVDYMTGRAAIRLYKQLQGNISFRDYASNIDLNPSKTTANKELSVKTGLNYLFSNGATLSADLEHFDKKDRLAPADYDFQEDTVNIDTGIMFKSVKVQSGIEKGLFTNELDGTKQNRERYRLNVFIKPTPAQMYSFNFNTGHYKYTESSGKSKSVGGKLNWKIRENIAFTLDVWKYNFGMGKSRERDSVFSTVNYTLRNNHIIAMKLYQSSYRNKLDKSIFFNYTIPLNMPANKIKSIGILTGRIVDLELAGNPPMQNVILILNGRTALTNKNGEFIFSSLKPGAYFLRIDEKSIGLNRVPSVKMPIEVIISGGKKTELEIGVRTSGKITGKVSLFSYSRKNGADSDSTESILNTIGGLIKGELLESGVQENVLLEITNGTDVIRMMSDSAGKFAFNDLIPGTWMLKVYNDALPVNHYIEKETQQIVLSPGQTIEVMVNVKPRQRQIQFVDRGEILVAVKKESAPQPTLKQTNNAGVNLQYTIQVASYPTLEAAQDDVLRYRSKGYTNAFFLTIVLPQKGLWYRVYVDRYETMEEAIKAAESLREQGLTTEPWVKKLDTDTDTRPVSEAPRKTGVQPYTAENNTRERYVPDPLVVSRTENPEDTIGVIIKSLETPVPSLKENVQDDNEEYTIQVAAYQNSMGALEEVRAYEKRGIEAFNVQIEIPGKGVWHRVCVGRYATRAEAENNARELIRKGYVIDPLVISRTENPVDNKEVTVKPLKTPLPSLTEDVRDDNGEYTVQVASYRDFSEAHKDVQVYEWHGIEAFQVQVEIPGKGVWHRVYVGRYSSREEADREAKFLIESGYARETWVKRIESNWLLSKR